MVLPSPRFVDSWGYLIYWGINHINYGDEMLLIAVAITKTIIFYIWDISITVTVSTITRLITAISFMVFYITTLHNLLIFWLSMTFRPGGDGMMFHNFLRQLLNDGMRDSVPPGQEIPHIYIIGYVEKYVNTYAYIYILLHTCLVSPSLRPTFWLA